MCNFTRKKINKQNFVKTEIAQQLPDRVLPRFKIILPFLYSDECLVEDMLPCESGHLFCKDCVQRASEVAIGNKYQIVSFRSRIMIILFEL